MHDGLEVKKCAVKRVVDYNEVEMVGLGHLGGGVAQAQIDGFGRVLAAARVPALGAVGAVAQVERIAPGLLDIIAINSEDLAAVPLQGWEVGSFLINDLRVVAGRRLEPRDQTPANGRQGGIMIGSAIARATQKSVGDTIEVLEGSSFEIVGVFNSFNIYENGSIVMPMIAQQKLMLREGEVTGIAVCTRQHDRETVRQVKQEIELLGPSLTANITREFAENLPEMKLAESVAWLTSSISLVVGSIGILNTMLMAVFERTGEIAMLRAIGWRRRRIVELILGESMVLAVTGAVIGCGLAVMLTHLLSSLPAAHRMVSGDISVKVFLWGFELAVAVGFLGGVYPAIRASRLLPVEGLRHN